MSWIKLDNKCLDHPKIGILTDRAFRAWVEGICYSSAYLTDGVLPTAFLRRVKSKARAELVAAGLWVATDGEIVIHDYLEHQSSREEVEGERAFESRRSAMRRDPALRAALQARDLNHCRYCDRPVSWTDRRGPLGATYDHVIPRGPETLENLVVACRKCNTTKGSRTPEQAGMVLLPARSEIKSRPRSEPEASRREPRLEIDVDVDPRSQNTAAKSAAVARTPIRHPSPLAWDRVHGQHVPGFCDWFCLPADVFGQIATRLGSEAEALAFARRVRGRFEASKDVPSGRPWTFWESQLAVEFPPVAAPSRTPDALAGVREALSRV